LLGNYVELEQRELPSHPASVQSYSHRVDCRRGVVQQSSLRDPVA